MPLNATEFSANIPEMHIDDLHFREILTTAKNRFAYTELHNNTSNTISICIDSPVKKVDFHGSIKEVFKFSIQNTF